MDIDVIDPGCPDNELSGVGPDGLPPLLYPPSLVEAWSVASDSGTASSPLLMDVNADGVSDLILGFGEERTGPEEPALGSLRAIDGATGGAIWTTEFSREYFTLPVRVRHPDTCEVLIVAGGRVGELAAVTPNGAVVWRFNGGDDPRESGLFNFYSPQVITDQDGDGFPDLLISNGGDTTIDPGEPRPPGHIMVISTATGAVIARAQTPDLSETYASVAYDSSAPGGAGLFFGTGGETNPGSFWFATLSAVLGEDLTEAELLFETSLPKGVIAPASLADVNGDGVVDVIGATFDGTGFAIDGQSRELLWRFDADEIRESYAAPALGHFDGDGVPDAFFSFSLGAFPEYTGVEHYAVSGATGALLWSERAAGVMANAALLADLDGDGLDEILVQRSGFAGVAFENRLLVVSPGTWESWTSEPRPGAGVGTGVVADLEGDGRLEWVGSSRRFLRGRQAWLWRVDLSAAAATVAWGGYLGTLGDRRYH